MKTRINLAVLAIVACMIQASTAFGFCYYTRPCSPANQCWGIWLGSSQSDCGTPPAAVGDDIVTVYGNTCNGGNVNGADACYVHIRYQRWPDPDTSTCKWVSSTEVSNPGCCATPCPPPGIGCEPDRVPQDPA